jgi:carboxyl-terminal processing protease
MEKKNTTRNILLVVVAVLLIACSFGGGLAAGHFLPLGSIPSLLIDTTPTVSSDQSGTPQDLQTLFTPFWDAWQLVHQNYVDQPVNDTQLMEGAINGMMQSLGDPHSSYMNPEEYQTATMQLQGSYAGIGAYVDQNGEFLTIIRPIANSPAEKAGLQPGDKIVAVDGTDVTGVDPAAVRQKVLGPEGTDVTLTIQRGDQAPFEVTITRAIITIPSVSSKMLDNNIAYIQITTFGDNTTQDFHDQLKQLMAQNPKGLILDLRNNPGGYLDAAVAIASEFIPSGVIVYERSGDGTKTPFEAISGGLATNPDLPLVVLVNGYSASASEIVAGAIQDTGRGKLLGETTYGKGSVQTWTPLSNNEGAVRVTIARWLTPNSRQIDKKGLTPDVSVALTEEDYKAGKDPQLDAAVQLLLNPQP